MYCRKCGKEVKETDKACPNCNVRPLNAMNYCQACGAVTNINMEQCASCGTFLKNIRNIVSTSTVSSDFSYLPAYYRAEFKKIHESNEAYKGRWNWSACVFNFLWAFQKGLWLSGSICLIVSILTGGIAGIIYSLVYGIRGNYIYYSAHAKNKQMPY